jgi:hypothetical protein
MRMSEAGPSGLTLAPAPANLGAVPAELFSFRLYLEAARVKRSLVQDAHSVVACVNSFCRAVIYNGVHRQEVFV